MEKPMFMTQLEALQLSAADEDPIKSVQRSRKAYFIQIS